MLAADEVSKAFNTNPPTGWKARPYMKLRSQTGVFNAVNFSYKNGMVALLMDCSVPFGRGFQIKFTSVHGSFGDYLYASGGR